MLWCGGSIIELIVIICGNKQQSTMTTTTTPTKGKRSGMDLTQRARALTWPGTKHVVLQLIVVVVVVCGGGGKKKSKRGRRVKSSLRAGTSQACEVLVKGWHQGRRLESTVWNQMLKMMKISKTMSSSQMARSSSEITRKAQTTLKHYCLEQI